MSPSQRRERFFNAFAANLTATARYWGGMPEIGDIFICPLCRTEFGREALAPPPQLTIEHCIPRSLGGTLTTSTLVCRACNNTAGTNLDKHLANKFDAESFFQGISAKAMPIEMNVHGAVVRGDWRFTAGGKPTFELYICGKRNGSKQIDFFKSSLTSLLGNADGSGIEVSAKMQYRGRNAIAGLLRIGYLMLFRQFGYGYILNSGLDGIREQILHPERSIIPDAISVDIPQALAHANSVAILKSPKNLRCFLAMVRLSVQNRIICRGILLPGPRDSDVAIYHRHEAAKNGRDRFRADVRLLRYDPVLLSAPDYVEAPFWDWDRVCAEVS
jgi:hypothetical protein